jgi:hypothetical protein
VAAWTVSGTAEVVVVTASEDSALSPSGELIFRTPQQSQKLSMEECAP